MLTQATFEEELSRLSGDFGSATYLLAASGGVDSMVLLHLFRQSGLSFEVAHINYKLRGAESDSDQRLIEDFCVQNGIRMHIYGVSEKEEKPEGSVQLWARNLRYTFFKNVQKAQKLDFIVTAHHLNDQLETFIINLSRASGLQGLAGIPAHENGIIRPMLNFSKEEIYGLAAQHNIKFREDQSNHKNDYLRNFIRNEIAPKFAETNVDFLQNFANSLNYLAQTKDFVKQQLSNIEDKIVSHKDDRILISKQPLMLQHDLVKFELLRKFGFKNKSEISKIFLAENGKSFHSADFFLKVERNFFVLNEKIRMPRDLSAEKILVSDQIEKSKTILLSEILHDDLLTSRDFQWDYDAEKISFPLILRHMKAGDEIFPVGMKGRKKVAKFFRDEKIPIFAQHKIWLLCDADDLVLGIIPFRQDRRFLAGSETEIIISIKL